LLQVTCHVFDPDAHLKSWDPVFISVGSSLVGFGSSREKSVARALGQNSPEDLQRASVPLSGCSVRVAAEHSGRRTILALSDPNRSMSFGIINTATSERIFSFAEPLTRDAFVQKLQNCQRQQQQQQQLILQQQQQQQQQLNGRSPFTIFLEAGEDVILHVMHPAPRRRLRCTLFPAE
jgi:hypothetical protein